MPLKIIKSDLVSMTTDAIVYDETPQPFSLFQFNPLMIHKTGKEILNTREALKPIIIGQAKIAPASLLDCKYIIHTSAPAWHGGSYHELSQLRTCYEKVFGLALEHGCKTIGMPIIASDKLGYPKSLSQKTAFECINEFLAAHTDMEVTLVLPGKAGIMLPGNQFTNVNMYLNKNYVEAKSEEEPDSSAAKPSEAFLSKLKHYIEVSGMSENELCFKANITSDTWNNLLHGNTDLLKKHTLIAFGMALELPLDDLKDLLSYAGYTLTAASKFDLIIEYCISQKMYNIFDVNQILFRFEQELLG